MEKGLLHVREASQLHGHARPVRVRLRRLSRPILQSPVSNVMENLSCSIVDLESLPLDLADDAGDRRSCLRFESRSGASRREGSLSATVHVRA